jgi:solute carrier family 24 (sodium/potassium/calcium exchanger), member 6
MANSFFTANVMKILKIILSISFLIIAVSWLTAQFDSSNPWLSHVNFSKRIAMTRTSYSNGSSRIDCEEVHKFNSYEEKCSYLNSESRCQSDGYINYIQLFYCAFGRLPVLGYMVLNLWLLILFYLRGTLLQTIFVPTLRPYRDSYIFPRPLLV